MKAGLFEVITTAGLEHAGRAAIAACTQLETGRATPAPARTDLPAAWFGQGPVVLVGGFAATGPVLAPMAAWLTRLGWDVHPVTAGAGLGCAGHTVDALTAQLHALADRTGAPVRVVGHSRGGQFARVAARRALDQGIDVAALVTLGSPFDLYGLRWPLLAQAAALSLAGSLGAPGLATLGCLRGSCCAAFRAGLRAPWPAMVPFTSVYSHRDRAVPAAASIDPHAVNVELDAGHLGLLTAPTAFTTVAHALTTRSITAGAVA